MGKIYFLIHLIFFSLIFIHLVARDDATPERDVGPTLTGGCCTFLVEVLHCRCGRNGVEGHVNERRDASRGGGSRARPESLPICPAGFVEMDMCAVQVSSTSSS